jgi:hypothetical protein
MFGSQVLDVAIGLIFVYLLLSVICTAVGELIASVFSLRARNLAKGITNLFADTQLKGLETLFYEHPLIKSLYQGSRKPSYIPSHTFALAFLDGIAPFEAYGTALLSQIRAAVAGLPSDSELKRLLSIFLQQAGDDFTKLQANIENWFDDAMTRVSGWYKRKSQAIVFILALLLTGITNADTVQIVKSLSTDTALRVSVVAQALEFARLQGPGAVRQPAQPAGTSAAGSPAEGGGTTPAPQPTAKPTPKEVIQETFGSLDALGIPLGWRAMPGEAEWPNKVIGLLLTTFAVSLGAPFWFDILNRFTKVRSSGAAPGEPQTPAKDETKK